MNAPLRYLLDTNIVSDLVRNPRGRVKDSIARHGENSVCTSIIVASELRFGARKRNSRRLAGQLEIVLSALQVLALDQPADAHYARLRHTLESKGTPIGPNDMFIAAHALSLNLILVSANEKEFSRVPGLQVENWLAP